MPIYEYKCAKCGAVSESLVREAGDEPEKCPKCGSRKLEKIMSVSSVSVKNGGTGTTRCGLGSPCCGADQPCSTPPCES
ncbi:MAG: zinc ribbon domain-containing protein [Planctomycetota bacterium]|nr:MAG: zinc ribbon domain-containing protein [Planctomycetota bacterium]